MDNTIPFLQNTEVFRGLTEDELEEVKHSFKKLSLKKDAPVVFMGDESDSVFLIKEGMCKVFIPFDFGMGENILSYLKKGDLFGEMGIITGKKRIANITCFTDVELLVMTGPDFWRAANQHPGILKNIIAILSDRLNAQNLRTSARGRASLNLNDSQRKTLGHFFSSIEQQNRTWVSRMMKTSVPVRSFRWSPLVPLKQCGNAILRFLIKLATSPYISKIQGLENIPEGKPVIFLLSFRTLFDFLFLYKVYDHLESKRAMSVALRVDGIGKIRFFFLRGLLSMMNISYLSRQYGGLSRGAEDAVNLLNHMQTKGRTADAALYPFSEKSMRYDRAMGYHHFIIWLMTGETRDIIPVTISGTDKFWPFEPWNRKFFDLSSFLNFKSVSIKIGDAISLKDMGLKEKLDSCDGNEEGIKRLFDRTNDAIGSSLAALHGHQYTPIYQGAEQELLRSFNDKWANRLSHMLPAGLGLRKKYRKSSVKIRHFTWHAEMLNVFLEHLEEEHYFLPPWAKGSLMVGASYADLEWPFFSMDHSYNPFTKKGMKLVIRFPDLLSTLKKEIQKLLRSAEQDMDVEKLLIKMGRIYHFLSDLAVPAHVHNIPHMFLDLPRIGKCDFEEHLGLDQPLLTLNQHEIGDISAVSVESFDDFYECVDNMARYTFLNSSFNYDQLKRIAKDRMISNFEDKNDLIRRLKKVGVAVMPVEGLTEEERYYVRNLTSLECEEISEKTTYYSLKTIASCFIFLMAMVNDKLERKEAPDSLSRLAA